MGKNKNVNRFCVRADRMLDVESGAIVENVVVEVEGDRIVNVGSQDSSGGEGIIDLGDMTLLPGLIDMHTHLSLEIEEGWLLRFVRETAADRTLRGVKNARLTLQAGFTTVRDLFSLDFVDVALMRATDAGWIEGPRIFPSGHPLNITGGHIDPSMLGGFAPGIFEGGPERGIADGVEEVLKAARYQIKYGATWIKVAATAGVISHEATVGAQQYSEEEMRVIVVEAARHGIKVAAHAHGTDGIKAAVRAGVASIEHGSVMDEEAIRLMLERGTWLVPTDYVVDSLDPESLTPLVRAKLEHIAPQMKAGHRLAIEAGVKIAFGTDSGAVPHGDNAKEFTAMTGLGMSSLDAIRSATVNAADLLGVEDRGIIAGGRLADMVAVPGNPLDDVSLLEDVRFVMKGGTVFRGPQGQEQLRSQTP